MIKVNNFTLIIPVRDRQYNIPRITSYFEDLECKKIIVDSSQSPYEKKILKGFDYVYYGPILFYEKMFDILNKIDTDYYADCADDDFIIKKSILECVEFLEKNKDYTIAHGQSGNLIKNGKYVNHQHKPICQAYVTQECLDFYSNDPIERIKYHLNAHWMMGNHSLLDKKVASSAFKLVIDHEFLRPVRFWDKILAFILACKGNQKVLPILYNIRYDGPRLINNSNYPKGLQKSTVIKALATEKMCDPLARFLMKEKKDLKYEEAINFVVNWFKNYENKIFPCENELTKNMPLFDSQYDEDKKIIKDLCKL